ncbi:MAG: anaerobic sulfatase maturase [Gemmatimonadota bacterium]|nr:MAG: anaerobic sulfatase maturase [Gemmatimonadota bacterium]
MRTETAAKEFQIFAKPGGAVCNLDCHYCYYLEKQGLYPRAKSFRMNDAVLEDYIVQHIQATTGPVIRFSWHGGEPTSLGVDYFRNIVSLQRGHQPSGKQIINGIVTNDTLLDDEWCRFLVAEGFAVGLSLDGPAELHDLYRVTKSQKPTHARVMDGLRLLRDYGIPYDVLCVVHDLNVRYPMQVYEFFKEIGATYVGFLPLVQRSKGLPRGVTQHTVPAGAYGSFLCTIFDEWIRHDIGRIMIQIFDEAARPLRALEHSLCVFRETCGDVPVLEHNGDLYSCDHFVDRGHLLGNICQTPLEELLSRPEQIRFGRNKRDYLPRYCRECDVLSMCNGGCPKDRFIESPDREARLNYLCSGLKQFFAHSRPFFAKLVPLWQAGATNEQLMAAVQGADAMVPHVGRNDPCPCGSGRKYKRCCLGKLRR